VRYAVGFQETGADVVPLGEGADRHLVLEEGPGLGGGNAAWPITLAQGAEEPVGRGRAEREELDPHLLRQRKMPVALQGGHQLR
jgi:hypothetical protein